MLDPVEEALDVIALFVKSLGETVSLLAVSLVGNVRCRTLGLDPLPDPVWFLARPVGGWTFALAAIALSWAREQCALNADYADKISSIAVDGCYILRDEAGYLVDSADWTAAVAERFALEEGVSATARTRKPRASVSSNGDTKQACKIRQPRAWSTG